MVTRLWAEREKDMKAKQNKLHADWTKTERKGGQMSKP
jgi:hypothetical protein